MGGWACVESMLSRTVRLSSSGALQSFRVGEIRAPTADARSALSEVRNLTLERTTGFDVLGQCSQRGVRSRSGEVVCRHAIG